MRQAPSKKSGQPKAHRHSYLYVHNVVKRITRKWDGWHFVCRLLYLWMSSAHERYATAAPQLKLYFQKTHYILRRTVMGLPWWQIYGNFEPDSFQYFQVRGTKIWQSKATVSFQFSNHAKKKYRVLKLQSGFYRTIFCRLVIQKSWLELKKDDAFTLLPMKNMT